VALRPRSNSGAIVSPFISQAPTECSLAEISNTFWLGFPGRVTGLKSPTRFGWLFRGGSLRESSSFPWLSFPGTGHLAARYVIDFIFVLA